MLRPILALGLFSTIIVVGLGVRSASHRRRYGDSGWRFTHLAGFAIVSHALLAVVYLLLLLAPAVALITGEPYRPLGWKLPAEADGLAGWTSLAVGTALGVAGMATVLVAQRQMGASWRFGLDTTESTSLITAGLFGYVRNPIYSGMALFAVGEALLLPNSLTLAALALGVIGMEVQVRRVEEPYLTRTHSAAYRTWAADRGRFVPGVGRLDP